MTPMAPTEVAGRKLPTHGASKFRSAALPSRACPERGKLDGHQLPYWEGPIVFAAAMTGLDIWR